MPFYRRWDNAAQDFIIDRDLTGPPKPSPSTGTTQGPDGTIIAASATIAIAPATPVEVTQPSPFEPMVDKNGRISAKWWRFFDQLYRRTGGVMDNVNRVPTTAVGAGGTVALGLTGATSTLLHNSIRKPAKVSLSFTGYAPTVTVA